MTSILTASGTITGSYRPEGGGDFGFAGATAGANLAAFDGIAFVVAPPEPAALAILGLGLAGLGFIRRRSAA